MSSKGWTLAVCFSFIGVFRSCRYTVPGYTVPGAAIKRDEKGIADADHYVSYDQCGMRQINRCDIYLWSWITLNWKPSRTSSSSVFIEYRPRALLKTNKTEAWVLGRTRVITYIYVYQVYTAVATYICGLLSRTAATIHIIRNVAAGVAKWYNATTAAAEQVRMQQYYTTSFVDGIYVKRILANASCKHVPGIWPTEALFWVLQAPNHAWRAVHCWRMHGVTPW